MSETEFMFKTLLLLVGLPAMVAWAVVNITLARRTKRKESGK